MVTVALVLMGLMLAVAAGEFVRVQCRRMLSRPILESGTPAAASTFAAEPVEAAVAA